MTELEFWSSVLPIELFFFLLPVCALLIGILMWFIYRKSLFFRLSMVNLLGMLVILELAYLHFFFDMTIGATLIFYSIGILWATFTTYYLVERVRPPVTALEYASNQIKEGNLDIEIKNLASYGHEFENLRIAFLEMLKPFGIIIKTAQMTTVQVASAAKELAIITEENNASIEEISSTMQSIAKGAQEQAGLATSTISGMNTMSKSVDEAIKTIESASKGIHDIASQTNILALNAAIEAARAGQYGRGFAVVADNVRSLAESSRNNATEIDQIASGMISEMDKNVNLIQESVSNIVSVSEEFSASTEEVSAAIEEVSASIEEMTTRTQEIAQRSTELAKSISKFKRE